MNKETQDLLESIYQEISKACFEDIIYDGLGEVVYLDTIKEIFEGRGVPASKLY